MGAELTGGHDTASAGTRSARLTAGGSATRQAAALLCLLLTAGGCASRPPGTAGGASYRAAASSTAPGGSSKAPAAAYLAIAGPANHQLDHEGDVYNHHARDNLPLAESALRAEAATERQFDEGLARIRFPARIAATARAIIRVNQHRIDLTELQAQSTTISGLLSFTSGHAADDAAVEAQTRIIRRQLGLPPPKTS